MYAEEKEYQFLLIGRKHNFTTIPPKILQTRDVEQGLAWVGSVYLGTLKHEETNSKYSTKSVGKEFL